MRVYLCFWRSGEKEDPEKDIVFATTNPARYDQWFEDSEKVDKKFRAYGHTVVYRHRNFSLGQVADFIYRGGPGV